jgi:arylsulfatase A-like enzyme
MLLLLQLFACRDPEPVPDLPPPFAQGPEPVAVQHGLFLAARVDAPEVGRRDLRCVVDGLPPDDPDLVVRYAWTVDGRTGPTGSRVAANLPAPGEIWACSATVERPFHPPLQVASAPHTVPEPLGGNVLVLLLDDLGTDKVARYGMHEDTPAMPRLDALMTQGVWFQTAYASPACSTTRAALLTGRHGRHTGFQRSLSVDQPPYALVSSEVTIAEMLRVADTDWGAVALGKWHLASAELLTEDLVRDQGFDWFQGTTANVSSYFAWNQRWADGSESRRRGYLPTAEVDDALAAIAEQPEPWFDYVAFHAAHTPFEAPPADLLSHPLPPDATAPEIHAAMLEAMDLELGRLLDGIAPDVLARTTVVLLGDNGTTGDVVLPPLSPDRAKLTLYEGGVRVPLVVTGPHVRAPGRRSDALVHVVDLFPTIADLAGVPLTGPPDALAVALGGGERTPTLDGVSLLPLLLDPEAAGGHRFLFAEEGGPNGGSADRVETTVRDADWKLLHRFTGDELYALGEGLDEGPDLLPDPDPAAIAAYARLTAALASFRLPEP